MDKADLFYIKIKIKNFTEFGVFLLPIFTDHSAAKANRLCSVTVIRSLSRGLQSHRQPAQLPCIQSK